MVETNFHRNELIMYNQQYNICLEIITLGFLHLLNTVMLF